MNARLMSLIGIWFLVACTSPLSKPLTVLQAPAGVSPAVAAELDRGNALFSAQKWAEAEQVYRQTIAAEPTLAEAHYNLATALYRAGNKVEAKKHYMEAANLAPGNKVIWDAPPLRASSVNDDLNKRSYLDAKPQ
ncbi:MAG: tetratricopeptide repeat protein [Nitrospirota bacterium]|nr:tetratricopeptide repeat protein [Nitrospirota bacterium]MDE3051387.1 tetratricopeptide repeat protein [Nitrospirota bacterium]MDE3221115.1 tetratricopeptide repeat protein [Nitrospirota bacterium]